jgi:hypothetical protein
MKKLLILLSLIVLFSCEKAGHEIVKADGDVILEAGYACGWGAGEDSLVITQTQVKYLYYVPQKSSHAVIETTRAITSSELTEIKNAIDMPTFNNLDFNTCNICFDGCDEWITLYEGDVSHKIRYSYGQQIESIAKLQGIIARIKAEFH